MMYFNIYVEPCDTPPCYLQKLYYFVYKLDAQWGEPVSLTFHSVFGASYQTAVHLVARFQRKIFFLEINQSEKRIACGGHVWSELG
jgi:hypothetical protein